jgi:hypothetical protein
MQGDGYPAELLDGFLGINADFRVFFSRDLVLFFHSDIVHKSQIQYKYKLQLQKRMLIDFVHLIFVEQLEKS